MPVIVPPAEHELVRDLLYQAYWYAWHRSPDPRTKNGAVLYDPLYDKVVAWGVNRLPIGVEEFPERLQPPGKYDEMLHAEHDAILCAARDGKATMNKVLFCPWACCRRCAQAIIQAGIYRVVAHRQACERTPERWQAEIEIAQERLKEAGVRYEWYAGPIGDIENLLDGEVWRP